MFIDDCSEAEYLMDREDDSCIIDDELFGEDSFRDKIEYEVEADEYIYRSGKKAKAGSIIKCAGPMCGKKFKKKSYQQAFCCSRCKDQFWNRREYVFGYRKRINNL